MNQYYLQVMRYYLYIPHILLKTEIYFFPFKSTFYLNLELYSTTDNGHFVYDGSEYSTVTKSRSTFEYRVTSEEKSEKFSKYFLMSFFVTESLYHILVFVH